MSLDTSEIFFWQLPIGELGKASHCYLRGPSDSFFFVAEHCDKKLETSPILFVNYIFGFLLFLRTLLILQTPMSKNETPKLVIPKHLAVAFTDHKANLFMNCLIDLIVYSVCYGIERLTFFDPWCILESKKCEIIANLEKYLVSIPIPRRVLFDDDKPDRNNVNALRVTILGASDGRQSLVRVCKQLCRSPKEISIADVYEKLAIGYIHDPDFLIKVGSLNSLGGYPPWNLRVTELLSIPSFEKRTYVEEYEFVKFLMIYSKRDRRLGK